MHFALTRSPVLPFTGLICHVKLDKPVKGRPHLFSSCTGLLSQNRLISSRLITAGAVTGRRASLQPTHEPTPQVHHVIKIATEVPKLDVALVTGNLEEAITLPPHHDP